MTNEFIKTDNCFFNTIPTHIDFGTGKLNNLSEFLPEAKKH